jgi:single-stranded-DNA-specific exonuclease
LAQRLTELARQKLDGQDLAPKLAIDAVVSLSEMDWATIEWLQQLEPCGQENDPPVFLSRGVTVAQAQAVGNEGRHLRLQLDGDGQVRDAIAFKQGERLEGLGDRVDVVYCLEANEWNGERRLQLNVQDIRPAEV